MPAAWPATLPFLDMEDGASYSSPDYHHRSQMDAGQPKERLRSADLPGQRVGTIPRVTLSQLVQFRDFYRNELNFGLQTFVVFDSLFWEVKEFKIVGQYTVVPIQGYYDISMTLDVIE